MMDEWQQCRYYDVQRVPVGRIFVRRKRNGDIQEHPKPYKFVAERGSRHQPWRYYVPLSGWCRVLLDASGRLHCRARIRGDKLVPCAFYAQQ